MLLQVMMFPFALIFFGGIISLIAVADPHHKRSAPRVGFPIFFAGIFSLILSWSLEALVETLSSGHRLEGVGFLSGYLAGMIGGAGLGLKLALKHKRHLVQSTIDEETHEDES